MGEKRRAEAGIVGSFGILGSLRVIPNGSGDALMLAPKIRVLLARLLLSANRIVPLPAIIDALWDDPPPRTARLTTQGYVKDLRQLLGDHGKELIITTDPGYKVVLADDELDLNVLVRLRDEADAAVRASNWTAASGKLHAALRLWRDEPLLDVPSSQLHREEVPALTETLLQVLDRRIEVDLRLGRHAALVPELRRLTESHPMREKFHGQLMMALYLSSRQAEAMDAYRRVWLMLREELGVAPAPDIRDLHKRILAGEQLLPGLPATVTVLAGNPARAIRPPAARFKRCVRRP